MSETPAPVWRTACASANNCVQVAFLAGGDVAVRDRFGNQLTYTAAEWDAFVGGIKDGEFDLPGKPSASAPVQTAPEGPQGVRVAEVGMTGCSDDSETAETLSGPQWVDTAQIRRNYLDELTREAVDAGSYAQPGPASYDQAHANSHASSGSSHVDEHVDLRHRYAEALRDRMAPQVTHYDSGMVIINTPKTSAEMLADAALAVRDSEMETLRAQIDRVHAEHAAIHAAMDDYAKRHNRACECEVIPTTRETADRMLAALDEHEVELIELTVEEYEAALANELARLGCTYDELVAMSRTGDYATPDHRLLWLRIKPAPEEPANGE